jgi:hypothetical protein
MDRKKFISNLSKGILGSAAGLALVKAKADSLKTNEIVGFNHIPTEDVVGENSVLHKSNSRGYANHGWLETRHTFSFANYYNPQRMNFGVLRVLNDDRVIAGKGFRKHPHNNMEIISIPLEGDLEHKDSMGNTAVIKEGDIQVMSAGKGVFHSEYNRNKDKEVRFLQIWLFPNQENVEPRYDQISIRDLKKQNSFYQVLSPRPDDQGVWIHQNAWFSIGDFEAGKSDTYKVQSKKNGVYVFVIEGEVQIGDQKLSKRDGFGIWDIKNFEVKSLAKSRVLLMDVPLV